MTDDVLPMITVEADRLPELLKVWLALLKVNVPLVAWKELDGAVRLPVPLTNNPDEPLMVIELVAWIVPLLAMLAVFTVKVPSLVRLPVPVTRSAGRLSVVL